MNKRRYLTLSLLLGICHFLISAGIVPLTLWFGNRSMAAQLKNVLLTVLHLGTKIFYFPIMSLALYPRHWFPGPWIYLPIFANSLLWGLMIAALFLGVRRFHRKRT